MRRATATGQRSAQAQQILRYHDSYIMIKVAFCYSFLDFAVAARLGRASRRPCPGARSPRCTRDSPRRHAAAPPPLSLCSLSSRAGASSLLIRPSPSRSPVQLLLCSRSRAALRPVAVMGPSRAASPASTSLSSHGEPTAHRRRPHRRRAPNAPAVGALRRLSIPPQLTPTSST